MVLFILEQQLLHTQWAGPSIKLFLWFTPNLGPNLLRKITVYVQYANAAAALANATVAFEPQIC